MKRKIVAFLSFFMAIILILLPGATHARYKTDVKVEAPVDFARTAGTIEAYMPTWTYGYDASRQCFPLQQGTYADIHYHITNTATANGIPYTDECDTEYYFRVVATNEADQVLIGSYEFCEYTSRGAKMLERKVFGENDVGYGPVKYDKNSGAFQKKSGDAWETIQESAYIDLMFTGVSTETATSQGLTGTRILKVQMFRPRKNGSKQILSDADLRIGVTNETGKVDLLFTYYSLGTPSTPIMTAEDESIQQSLELKDVPVGTYIDFCDPENLAANGITLPEGYSFVKGADGSIISGVNSAAWDWSEAKTAFYTTNTMSVGKPMQVTLIRDDSIPVLFQYWDRSEKSDGVFKSIRTATKVNEDGTVDATEINTLTSQYVQVKKGSIIDFETGSITTDPETENEKTVPLAEAGIKVPANIVKDQKDEAGGDVYRAYNSKYIAAHCNVQRWWTDPTGAHYYQDQFKVPTSPAVATAIIDVYMAPVNMREQVRVYLYKGVANSTPVKIGEATVNVTTAADGRRIITVTPAMAKGWMPAYTNKLEVGLVLDGTVNTCWLGNAVNNGADQSSITIDCFEIYQPAGKENQQDGYCLSNTAIRLCVIGW